MNWFNGLRNRTKIQSFKNLTLAKPFELHKGVHQGYPLFFTCSLLLWKHWLLQLERQRGLTLSKIFPFLKCNPQHQISQYVNMLMTPYLLWEQKCLAWIMLWGFYVLSDLLLASRLIGITMWHIGAVEELHSSGWRNIIGSGQQTEIFQIYLAPFLVFLWSCRMLTNSF